METPARCSECPGAITQEPRMFSLGLPDGLAAQITDTVFTIVVPTKAR